MPIDPLKRRRATTVEFLPAARRSHLAIEKLDEETVVYDLESNRAHSLNPFASRLWQACDGRTSVGDLKKAAAGSEAQILQGLSELAAADLLKERPWDELTRRRALGRLGRAAALPTVVSILVPTPSGAASCLANGAFCGTSSAVCCSGCCKRTGAGANTCVSSGSGSCF